MALKQADILEHNNPAYALMDANELRGYYGIDLLTERDTIPIDKRSLIQMVLCRDEGMTYSYVGLTVDDADWTNDANWVVTGGGDVIPEIVHVNTTDELTAALYIERESLLVVLHADMNLLFGNLRCSNLTIIGPYKLSLSFLIATLNQVNITISIYSECHLNDTTAGTSNLFFLPNTSNGQKLLMRFRKLTTELPLQFGGKETTTFTIHCDNALEYIEPTAPNTILLNQENFGSPKIEICDQTDVEIDVPIENTKAVSALLAWQGFVYWCANTVFAGLNTTAKTIIGAINEIVDALNDHISSTDNPHGTRFADLLNKEHTHTATEVLNDSTNKTGANVKLVIDDLVNHYQQATAPTISSTPALKKDDTWLDTTTLIKYAYTADSNNVLNWVNVNQCGAEIPNVASGERVVTKSTTGVQVAKTLIDMQIAAGTIASANWSTGQATYTGQQGQTTYDANYKYECIGTNKWIRTALMEARLQLYLSPDIDDSLGAKTSAELDTAYPSAVIGQRVWGLLFLYEKKAINIWKKISAVTA